MNYMDEIMRISALCSYLGRLIICGNAEAVKLLYGNLWTENPALVRTTTQLQDCLTSVEIEEYSDTYDTEFLYYWAMICLGEQSPLIVRNLETAETCFRIIEDTVPVAKARLAYIGLLQSDQPAKSDENIYRIETLRKCGAYQRDFFSSIALSKIAFHSFLMEKQENNADNSPLEISEPPIRVMRLLERPLQMGHPVAVRFWNEILTCLDSPDAMSKRIDHSCIRSSVLYDFKTSANMQIRL